MEDNIRLNRTLSVRDLVVYGMNYMIPIAPFAWYGSFIAPSQGMVALAYLIGLVAMLFTGFSYATMARNYPVSGSVYSYVQRSTKPGLGFMAGWAIMLDYLFVPAVCTLLGGMFFGQLIPSVPQWVWIVIFAVISTIINYLGIRMVAWFSWAIFWFQAIVIVWFGVDVLLAMSSGHAHLNAVSFYNAHNFNLHGVLSATVIVVVSYLGFDAVSTLSEEAKDPRKSIGKATVLSIVFVGAIFIVESWLAGVAFPDFASLNSDTAFLDILQTVGGTPLVTMAILAITLAFGLACNIESQTSISRVLFSMGRDGILPKVFASLHPKYKTPAFGIVATGVFNLLIALILGLDLIAQLLSFGALLAFCALNAAVIYKFYIKNESKDAGAFIKYLISPLIGLVICFYIFINSTPSAFEVGGSWLVIGFLYLLYQTRGFSKPAPVLALEEIVEDVQLNTVGVRG